MQLSLVQGTKNDLKTAQNKKPSMHVGLHFLTFLSFLSFLSTSYHQHLDLARLNNRKRQVLIFGKKDEKDQRPWLLALSLSGDKSGHRMVQLRKASSSAQILFSASRHRSRVEDRKKIIPDQKKLKHSDLKKILPISSKFSGRLGIIFF